MKKRNMLFTGLVSAVVIMSSVSLHAMAEENVVFTYDFDNLADVEISEVGTTAVNDVLSVYREAETTTVSFGETTGTKPEGTSLTADGETDIDIYLQDCITTTKANTNAKITLPALNTAQNDIKISFNLYAKATKNSGRDNIVYAALTGNSKTYKIIQYTSAKGGNSTPTLKTNAAGASDTVNVNGKWCYYEIILHTAKKEIDVFRKVAGSEESVTLAEGIDASDLFDVDTVSEISFGTAAPKVVTATGDIVRVDDITVSETAQESAITEFSVSEPKIYADDAVVTQIAAGTSVVGKVHVAVPAGLEEDKSVALIGALYDNNGVLEDAYLAGTKTYLAGGEATEEDITLSMPLTGAKAGYTVKLFVWNSTKDMIKLSDVIGTASVVE